MTYTCFLNENLKEKEEVWWVPHPENNILYPQGQHKWIDDLNNYIDRCLLIGIDGSIHLLITKSDLMVRK